MVMPISTVPLSIEQIVGAVSEPHVGAVVTFTGVVRNHDHGKAVVALTYSAHPSAEQTLQSICDEMSGISGLSACGSHRIGRLQVGDLALVVAVAAAHRDEAFSRCTQLVERIKYEVPIWKQQHFAHADSEWVGL